jgi:uncharacterized protein (TIGR03435 family)
MARTSFLQALIAATLACVPAIAQEFEAASIRENRNPTGAQFDCPNGRLQITGQSLRTLLFFALDARPYQLINLPARLANTAFDINAVPGTPLTTTQCRAATERLLVSRFGLRYHREEREMDALILTVDRDGPRFHPAPVEGGVRIIVNGQPMGFGYLGPGERPAIPTGWTMRQLLSQVEFATAMATGGQNVPTFDRTGLTGRYQFTLEYSVSFPGQPNGPSSDGPDIAAALRSQLGLRLDRRKEMIPVFVIDNLSAPEPN